MDTFTNCCVLAIFVTMVNGKLTGEALERHIEIQKACQQETGSYPHESDESEEALKKTKCYTKCLLEKAGMMNSDGTIDIKAMSLTLYQEVKHIYGDRLDEIEKETEECANDARKNYDDACELAYAFAKCQHGKISIKVAGTQGEVTINNSTS